MRCFSLAVRSSSAGSRWRFDFRRLEIQLWAGLWRAGAVGGASAASAAKRTGSGATREHATRARDDQTSEASEGIGWGGLWRGAVHGAESVSSCTANERSE
jgi:hypothetical protein